MKKQILSVTSILAVLLPVTAAHAETLKEALALTYNSNPTLSAQRANVRSVDEGVAQALSGWRPTVTVVGEAGTEYNKNASTAGSNSARTYNPSSLALSVTQPLYTGGQTEAGTKAAEANVKAARASLDSTEQSILQSAVSAYMNVVRDKAVVELNQNNVVVLERQLEAAKDRFDVGEITRTDVAQAEARLAGAKSELVQAIGNLKVSEANYERIVGQKPGNVKYPPLPAEFPESVDAAFELGKGNHPDIKAAQFQEESSKHTIRQTSGRLLPTLTLNGSVSHSDDQSSENQWGEAGSISATLTVPLYQSGSVYSSVRQARQINSQRKIEIEAAIRQVREAVARSWEQLEAARAQITSTEEQVRANRIALEGVTQEAQVGSRTTLDVLDAEQELLNSQVNLVTARRNLMVAMYDVLAAIGSLSAEAQQLEVEYYDPQVNYNRVRNKWVGTDGGLN
ncbi:TolC family outer membrane protein [Sneathiella sp. P13V-1]|uniref:TolC family outer membrane protein n=1 Tax=Sneathiella sp. P13V-1 TaxID=2697366 RepID=UPI00187B8E6E|nr:TolC family outer membrane protein [Sneathiella sp. P13V-1]MBE7637095.1 TolC family outer membrane protein [Sneathiella sp. P13V-1]